MNKNNLFHNARYEFRFKVLYLSFLYVFLIFIHIAGKENFDSDLNHSR